MFQKIGYSFPGERSACYSADLLLRQYKRVRDEKNRAKQKFSYKDIKIIFITLDIFRKNMQNKSIDNELDAWFMFFSSEDPERIIELIDKYPMFRDLYDDIYGICRNMEKVMGMFSKELRELDRNTVQYMIDEMQETIDAQAAALEEERKELEEERMKYAQALKRIKELESKLK